MAEHALRVLRALAMSHLQWPPLHQFARPATLEPPLGLLNLRQPTLYALPDSMSVAHTTLPVVVALVVTVKRPDRAFKGRVLHWLTRMEWSLSPQVAPIWPRREEAVQVLGTVALQAWGEIAVPMVFRVENSALQHQERA